MAVFMFLFLCFFLVAMVFTLLSYTKWAPENMLWISEIYFYVIIGAIIGVCLVISGFYIAKAIVLDLTDTF